MDYVEAEGNTIDDAIAQALEQLGVPREKAEVEILCDTTRGLFGIGGRKARVRATIRRDLELLSPDVPVQEPEVTSEAAASAIEQETLAKATPGTIEQQANEDDEAQVTEVASKETVGSNGTLEMARGVLQEIIGLMQVEADVAVTNTQELVISGDKRGALIGRRGQTLDALEYVLNRIVARTDQAGRITIDSENYRERRRQSLEALAKKLAKRVHRRGKSVSLSPMSPRDRRIVHLALQGDSSLVTRSTGDGYFRRLVIAPAGLRGRSRQRGQRKEATSQE
jgi:spoIIIJ-associated protein